MQPATYVIIVYVPYSCVAGRQLHEWVSVCLTFKLRATLDKGPGTKSPGTNWKQIEPRIGPLFTFKRTFFLKVQWVCLKAWGPIWGSNIKFLRLTCERIRLTFGFFSLLLFFHGFFYFLFSPSFHALGRAENSLFLVSTLQGSTKPTMLTLELIKKWGSWCALNIVLLNP
jgi:hypothetical protein